jgi:leucyl-tRNA synthetase
MPMTISPNSEQERAAPAERRRFRYTGDLAQQIETRWQDWWDEHHTFETPNPAGPLADPERLAANAAKVYVLDMFPVPERRRAARWHPLGFIGTDVVSRY